MKRIGAMAATAMIALLLALPLGLAMAQDGNSGNVPPATLFGTAMADGFAVPPGTMIVAMVGDEKSWFDGSNGRRQVWPVDPDGPQRR